MFLLHELPTGYALFELCDEQKLKTLEADKNLNETFSYPNDVAKLLKLTHFQKFNDPSYASAATVETKRSKSLESIIKKYFGIKPNQKLMVTDLGLGHTIKGKFNLQYVYNQLMFKIMHLIEDNLPSLDIMPLEEDPAMQLGLVNSLARCKLDFFSDKTDTMIIHAVGMLDLVEEKLNASITWWREKYERDYPELRWITCDNLTYIEIIKFIQTRDEAGTIDMSDFLLEEIANKTNEIAAILMGFRTASIDVMNISYRLDRIAEMSKVRDRLSDYVKTRMLTIAPNLSVLLDGLVGARLLARAGSLMDLANSPKSTIEILGAEERALKMRAARRILNGKPTTKQKNRKKYSLLYDLSFVTRASKKNKWKMARITADKVARAIRMDASGGDNVDNQLGMILRNTLENRLHNMEYGNESRQSKTKKTRTKSQKYTGKVQVPENSTTEKKVDTSIKKKDEKKEQPLEKNTTTAKDVPQEETERKVQEEVQEESSEKMKKEEKRQLDTSEERVASEVQDSQEAESPEKRR